MSNTTDKSREAIDTALIALTAIKSSSELAARTTDSKENPISRESEIDIIHSIANSALESLHSYLDG